MGIDDEAQVGEHVLDFFAFVEPDAADDAVRHTLAHECIFNGSRLRVGAIQHRDHRLWVLLSRFSNGAGDVIRLFDLIAGAHVENLLAALFVGPELLLFASAVATDHGRCRVENDLGRSVVLLEAHDHGFRKILFEVEDVLEVGAAPFVDRLIGVADHAEVAMNLSESLDQQVLRTVRVLILVDHDVFELATVRLSNALVAFEQIDGLQQQVVEVEGAGVVEHAQVHLVDLGDLRIAQRPTGRLHLVRRFHLVLGLADARQRGSGLNQLVVDVEGFQRLFDDGELIG